MRKTLVTLLVASWGALPLVALAGSQTYSTPSTYYGFVVPSYSSLTVTVNGAGGGGGGVTGSPGSAGSLSSFNGSAVGNGGGGGAAVPEYFGNGAAGSPGTASGGNSSNTTGGGAAGGSGTTFAGRVAGAGGAGGQAVSTYASGALTVGSTITVVVGSGGTGGAGGSGHGQTVPPGSNGAAGSVVITWTEACPTDAPSPWTSGRLVYSGGTYRINAQGYNFCISNSSGYNYYVPVATQAELAAFVNRIPYLSGLTTF